MATFTELLFEVVDAQQTGATLKIVANEPHYPIDRKMMELEDECYNLVGGCPIEGRLYLVSNTSLIGYPDLLFENINFKKEFPFDRRYGYLIPKER